jgi:alkanesulfonate monooxygenase SsuD/methylene tetrahydromethanopterin reductase-like flavin-dependent oxidoreductase (luciferase family)
MRFGLLYDFRNPPAWREPDTRLYAETLEQMVYAEQLGYDSVWISEHHFLEDGYLPSLFVMAGAISQRTQRVRIGASVLLLPMHDPLRVAEDGAVADILSNGRLDVGVGLGYREEEFQAFGVPRHQRPSRMEENLEILLKAWTEERFSYEGRYHHLENLAVRPRPLQRPHPPIWMAASSTPAAQRAARYRLPLTMRGGPSVSRAYADALRAQGDDPADFEVLTRRSIYVTDDPEAAWAQIQPYIEYQTEAYASWDNPGLNAATDQQRSLPERARQTWIIGNAAEVIAAIEGLQTSLGLTELISFGVPPGMPPSLMLPAIERFAREVMPHFRVSREP